MFLSKHLLDLEPNDSKSKILVVDDDPNILIVLGHLLESKFDLSVLSDSVQTFEVIRTIKPDLILLDVLMPELGGYAICEQLKSNPELSHIPVIFLTALDDNLSQLKGFELGAVDYITKPFDVDVLFHRIRNHLQVKLYRDRLEQTLDHYAAAKKEAEIANQAKTFFLAHMSHELRTPIQGILAALNQALKYSGHPKQIDLLKKADYTSKYLLNLINDILDITQIESDQLRLIQEPFVMQDVVNHTLASVALLADNKLLELKVEANPADLKKTVIGDEKRLGQVLINLLGNAIKFTQEGQVVITIRSTALPDQRCQFYFEVKDTGIGIKKEDQERIFDLYEQADSTQKKMQGTGLGLAICSKLIRAMGAQIELESQEGKGSRFYFTIEFPEALEPLTRPEQKTDYAALIKQEFEGLSILVVDDDLFLQELMADILESTGLKVSTAYNGMEAVELVRMKRFAIILIDMQMPVMSGIEATQQIRKIPWYSQTPILGLTGNILKTDHESCRMAGMNDVYIKPLNYEQLCQLLHYWLKETQTGIK